MKNIMSIVFCLLAISGLNKVGAEDIKISSETAKQIIRQRAQEAILVLKNKDIKHLARLVHPDKGIMFTQSPYIQNGAKGFSRKQVSRFSFRNTEIFATVPIGGEGDDKDYTFNQYFNRYIYDKDFASAPEVNFNKIVLRGSITNNLSEIFSKGIIVEYSFPGFDPKKQGMDWESLFLVFEKADDSKWYLVDVTHFEWSI